MEKQNLQKKLLSFSKQCTRPTTIANFRSKKYSRKLVTTHQSKRGGNSSSCHCDFNSFIYKDHVTFQKYTIQQLKEFAGGQANEQFFEKAKNLIDKVNLSIIRNIRVNRNYNLSKKHRKDLMQQLQAKKTNSLFFPRSMQLKKQINHANLNYFRQYVKGQKSFVDQISELQRIGKKGIINEKDQSNIKKLLKYCVGNHRKQEFIYKLGLEEKNNISKQFDRKFESIEQKFHQEIKNRVKGEAQFNWNNIR